MIVLLLALAVCLDPAYVNAEGSKPTINKENSLITTDDREKAVRHLENIQRLIYFELGKVPLFADKNSYKDFTDYADDKYMKSSNTVGTDAQKKEFLEKINQELQNQKLQSKYEDPTGYYLIDSLNKEIQQVISSLSIKIDSKPIIGTLPTREVNARAFPVPGTELVIIAFDEQIFNFAYLFSKAVANAIPDSSRQNGKTFFEISEEKVRKRIVSNPEVLTRFQEVLQAYLLEGLPGAAPQYYQPEPHLSLSTIICRSMELFILGHEYGHFIQNHLFDGLTVKSVIGDKEVTEIERSWSDEIEADGCGVQLSMTAMQKSKYDESIGYCGADLFLTCLDIVHRASSILRTGKEDVFDPDDLHSSSHPHPVLRKHYLREKLLPRIIDPETKEQIVNFAELLEIAVEVLWEKTKPIFINKFKDGNRLHSSWR